MNNLDSNEEIESESSNKFSIRSGYEFYFQDGERNIQANGSAFSGKETIYVNHKIVSQLRSFRRKSIHQFTINNDEYELEFYMFNILKGFLHCTLIKNGVHFQTLKLAADIQHKPVSKFILISFIIGLVFGVIATKLIKYWF